MPHTIIDSREPLAIPAGHLVWGMIKDARDLETNSLPIEEFSAIHSKFSLGNLLFEGSGAEFVSVFKDRIEHILQANGAFFNGSDQKGHAQKNQNISFNTIQPYPAGMKKGLFPTIIIEP